VGDAGIHRRRPVPWASMLCVRGDSFRSLIACLLFFITQPNHQVRYVPRLLPRSACVVIAGLRRATREGAEFQVKAQYVYLLPPRISSRVRMIIPKCR
jgi:hypothetical protein